MLQTQAAFFKAHSIEARSGSVSMTAPIARIMLQKTSKVGSYTLDSHTRTLGAVRCGVGETLTVSTDGVSQSYS